MCLSFHHPDLFKPTPMVSGQAPQEKAMQTDNPQAALGTLEHLVRCLWFRSGWIRAHNGRPRPCLQTYEERLWSRFLIANYRVSQAMQANISHHVEHQR
jgi:hypothetical protein